MAKKNRKRRWLITLAIVVAAGIAAAVFYPKSDNRVTVTTEKAARRTITSTVVATGKIHPEVEVKISSEVAGEIIDLPVKEGQRVKKGDLLARVDPETLQSQVRRQEAAIETAKARAEQTRVRLERAKQILSDQEGLFENKFISADQLQETRAQVHEYEASYLAALSQIREQEMQLSEAKETLSKATIFSPMDGVVSILNSEIGERVVGTGQFEGTEIMRVADLDNMELHIEVSETDIVQVSIGDRARIEVDALPNVTLIGKVKEIASSAAMATSTGGGGGGNNSETVTSFLVKVRIDEKDLRLKPGMTATAEIETDTVENVISVPIQAVTVRDRQQVDGVTSKAPPAARPTGAPGGPGGPRPGGGPPGGGRSRDNLRRVVFVLDGDVARLRVVETGIADTSHIEIKAGISEGEEIVSGSYSAITRELSDGSEVQRRAGFGR